MERRDVYNTWGLPYYDGPLDNLNPRAWHKAIRHAQISNFSRHDLRRTWWSWHVTSDTPLDVLMRLGG